MKRVFAILLFSGTPALADTCLSYSGEVTLRGLLSKHTFAEQPNYESIAKGDAAATYFFIVPSKPFCVSAGAESNGESAVDRVKRVQLLFTGKKDPYGPLRPLLGKEVLCYGHLFPAISGHHHSPVLLDDAKCSGFQKVIPADAHAAKFRH